MGMLWNFCKALSSDTDIETEEDLEQTLRNEGKNELLKRLYKNKKSQQQENSVVQKVKTPTVSPKEKTEPTREDDGKELE